MRDLRLTAVVMLTFATVAAAQQQPRVLTATDYARAEQFLAANTFPLVTGMTSPPTWLDDGRFWYRVSTNGGSTFVVVDPARAHRSQLLEPPADPARPHASPPNSAESPDGNYAAFIRNHNLWVKDLRTGQDIQLTTDGVEDFGYATNNAGWIKSPAPVVLWSPDSRKIATFQHDARGVGKMHLVRTTDGEPVLESWRYPLPKDSVIFRIHRVIIDVPARKVVRLQMQPDQHRSTISDHVAEGTHFLDVEWYPDASHVAFVSSSRDHKVATFRVANAETGAVRTVFEERSPTQFQSGFAGVGSVNWRVLPQTNEVLWWSQRSDWGHLYLYDLATGAVKRQVTSGAWNVAAVEHVDTKARVIYFAGLGREAKRDPYFSHFYRIRMDGKGLTLLTPENAHHQISLSRDARYFVDTYSTPVTPPVTVLRNASNGRVLMTLEQGDISRLLASGWKAPQQIVVKARDGKTDLHGLMFTPTNLDPTRKYPIVNYIYPGPWGSSVGPRSFSPARGDHQALAELGFIVVAIDGMGTEFRSKSFGDFYYGNMSDNTLPDQIAGMKELAQKHSFIDIDKAGIWGHSGGGYATASAMFRHPDFFKVGVSQAGNHDNRLYEDDWGERFQGLLTTSGGKTNYDSQANQLVAANLKGKLLLAHGALDDNVPPYNTYAVVDALVKAGKDFDLIMFPHQRHGFGVDNNYMTRRRWDYFVQHLMGATPPKEYQIGRPRT